MVAKTANFSAKVEPDLRIPFSLSLHKEPDSRNEAASDEFNTMMAKGLAQAKANDSRPATDVIADIKHDIKEWTR